MVSCVAPYPHCHYRIKLLLSLSVSLTVTIQFEKKTMKEPDFSLAKASLGCAQVHVEIHFPVAAGMQLMGGWRGGKATP